MRLIRGWEVSIGSYESWWWGLVKLGPNRYGLDLYKWRIRLEWYSQ